MQGRLPADQEGRAARETQHFLVVRLPSGLCLGALIPATWSPVLDVGARRPEPPSPPPPPPPKHTTPTAAQETPLPPPVPGAGSGRRARWETTRRKHSLAPRKPFKTETPYTSYTCIREERQRFASRFALFSFVAAFLSHFFAPLALERQKGEAKAGPRKGEGTWPSHEWSACSAGRDARERPFPSATVFLCQLVGEGRKAVGGGARAGETCFQPLGSRSSQFPGEAWSVLGNAVGQRLDLRRGSRCPENPLLADSGKGRSRTKVRTTEVKATGYLSCPPLAALENCTRKKTAPPFRSDLTVFLRRPLLENNNIKLASKELHRVQLGITLDLTQS
nr:uncharacterized protein LOC103227231 [Chlorocebus sabaeus]